MSIRLRLTLWYTAILFVTLSVFAVVIYMGLARSWRNDLDTTIRGRAQEARAQITAGRPPQTVPGDPLRVLIALPILVQFPEQGAYCVRAQMEGAQQDVVVRFQVVNALMVVPPEGPNR